MHSDLPLALRVAGRETGPGPLVMLQLVAVDGTPLPAWTPGSRLAVSVPDLGQRHYALCGEPGELDVYDIAVQREDAGRSGSVAMHALRVGDTLRASSPRNLFALHDDAAGCVLIAGGVGITPLLSMFRAREASGQPWTLHYAIRDADRAYFKDLPNEPGRASHVQWYQADRDEQIKPLSLLAGLTAGTAVYCCGPAGLMNAVQEATQLRPDIKAFFEGFVPATPTAADTSQFMIVCQAFGRRLLVASSQGILQTVEAAGIAAPYSCREGICGACETTVIMGQPEHRDSVLSNEERASGSKIMICVSGSRSPELVIDL